MAMNAFVGWGVTTLLSLFLNKSDSPTSSDPAYLAAETSELGAPVPVVFGRQIIKTPLIVYYGDFSSQIYTETYATHGAFSAWPLILSMLAAWISMPITGQDVVTHNHTVTATGGNSGGPVTVNGLSDPNIPAPIPTKEIAGPNYLMLLAQWLLGCLINGRLLKTTVQKGFKYFLGYQMIVCVSGADIRLRGLYIGYDAHSEYDNSAAVWMGNVSREDHQTAPYVVPVHNDNLMGGMDEGGGFNGDIHAYLGGPNQPADPWMIQQMSADSVQPELRGLTPAYRPFVSLVVPTAYIGKQASVPVTYVDVQWIPNRLGLGGIGDNDANPAEIIYEAHVNNEWGLGRDASELNVDSLKKVGAALKAEGHGVSIKLTNKTETQTLIDNLCTHLDMVRYTDPANGKLAFKLIRDDYDINDLPVIDSSIASSIDYTRTVWSSSAGEVVAKYSDSSSLYNTSSVSDDDPAIIEANKGDRNSQDEDFSYFTTAANAKWAANRELHQKGYPLASVKLTCNRHAYTYRPGDVFKLNWAPYGISNLVMRVSDVDLGDFVSGEIMIEAVEDVFGVGKTTYSSSDSTSWKPPTVYPSGVQLFGYFEAPWELQHSKESYVYALAAVPDATTLKWNIWREKDLSWVNTNAMLRWTPTAYLVGNLSEAGDTEDIVGVEIASRGGILELAARSTESGLAMARNGSRILMVGDELMGWGTITQLANGNFKLSDIIRGTYDTVPENHSAGDTLFFLDAGYYANVTTGGPVCPEGYTASEHYNITTSTTYADEAFDTAKIKALTTVRRSERPVAPGRIRLSSHMQLLSRPSKIVGDLVLSWASRNKMQSNGCVSQEDLADYYTGAGIKAPDGLITVVRMFSGATKIYEQFINQINSETAMPETPTAATITWAQRCLALNSFTDNTMITICSKLNDLESYQSQSRTLSWKPPYMVSACDTETNALAIMQDICTDDASVIKFADATLNRSIAYGDMPLMILGEVHTEQVAGAVLAQNGTWIVPNGQALALTSATTFDRVTLENGYILLTYLNPSDLGTLAAYQFDGLVFNKIAVPAM